MADSESSLLLPWQPQAATMAAEMQFSGWLMPGVVTAGAEGSRGGVADAWGGGPSRRGTAAAHAGPIGAVDSHELQRPRRRGAARHNIHRDPIEAVKSRRDALRPRYGSIDAGWRRSAIGEHLVE
ncbi:unnamed protein product [Miscanthus lutarioriparius]|uniref:Uncharacterized protein n=1 Tax=Miscanthus lutarioriparius TaxID=422564 RepID=A0A811QZ44_9POAL|nr:unnamed protein product [Miscanthus lutarioriparius]